MMIEQRIGHDFSARQRRRRPDLSGSSDLSNRSRQGNGQKHFRAALRQKVEAVLEPLSATAILVALRLLQTSSIAIFLAEPGSASRACAVIDFAMTKG